jgi:hypothetical protein
MRNDKFIAELGLWISNFGDVNLLYDNIIKDLWLKPERITDNIILLRNLGIDKIYNFHVEHPSNMNTTRNFFLYRQLDSEVILIYDTPHTVLAFEENGLTLYKPDKVTYYYYRKTEIYHIYPRNVYHIYYEGVKLIIHNNEIVIHQARQETKA